MLGVPLADIGLPDRTSPQDANRTHSDSHFDPQSPGGVTSPEAPSPEAVFGGNNNNNNSGSSSGSGSGSVYGSGSGSGVGSGVGQRLCSSMKP